MSRTRHLCDACLVRYREEWPGLGDGEVQAAHRGRSHRGGRHHVCDRCGRKPARWTARAMTYPPNKAGSR